MLMLNPNQPFARGLRTVLALLILALAGLAASAILTATGTAALLGVVVSGAFSVFLGVALAAILGAGAVRRRQIGAFLVGDRAMVRWTYTPEQTARIRAERWDDERVDWKVQFGCLTVLFGLVGVLVGVMGYLSGELNPLVAAGVGVAFGATVGGVVAAANHAGVRAERAATGPIDVALGIGEFTFDGEYFCEHGAEHVIESLRLDESARRDDGVTPDLVIETWSHPWYQRTPMEREWHIPVPPERAEAVRRLVEAVDRTM